MWKEANVTPIFKKKEDPSVVFNYRPISLHSAVGEVLEKSYISICLTTFAIMTYCQLHNRDSFPATQQSTSSSIYIILFVNLLTKVKKFEQCFAT